MTEASVPSRTGAARWRPLGWLQQDDLFHHPEFAKLWVGQSISVLGSEITTIALPLTAILTLHASAGEIGLLNTTRTIPFIAVTLFAGVLVDRFRRRPTMIIADIGRALAIGAIPALAVAGHLTMHALYVCAFVVGTLTIVFDLAKYAYLPSILTGEQLVSGNSRLVATEWVGGTAGSSLGGLLVSTFKPVYPLIGDAVSFVVSAFTLAAIPSQEAPPARRAPGTRQVFADIWEGIRWTYKHPYLRPLTFNSAGTNFFAQIILTLLIFWYVHGLHLSPVSIGIIYAFAAIGAVAGAVVTPRVTRLLGVGKTILAGMGVYRVLTLMPLVVFVPGPKIVLVVVLCVINFFTLVGVAVSNIGQGALRQHITPPSLQGRVSAAGRFLYFGILPIGALLAGLLGDQIGAYKAIAISCPLLMLPALFVYFSPVRAVRELEDEHAGEDPPAEADGRCAA